MKTYFADANVFLRFILQDNKILAQKAKKYFLDAKKGEIKIVFLPEVIIEINYVLEKVYSISRKGICEYLSYLLETPYFEIKNGELLSEALKIYSRVAADFVDILLYVSARKEKGQVLSFDKDFKKLTRKRLMP